MIQRTEYGILVPFEEWDEIQEKLCATISSQDLENLEKENNSLREILARLTIFLAAGDP